MKTFSITDVGMVRQVNQDYVFTTGKPLGILQNLFVVADGMGGHQAGDYASKCTVEVMIKEIAKSEGEDIERVLVKAIKAANREIIKEASSDEHLKGMGTTVVAATVKEQMLYFANVGDSRLYLVRGGLIQVTKDHSYVEEMVSLGLLNRGSKDYQMKKNYITRAIGTEPEVEPDFFEVALHEGDMILLCSDGLSNMVSDKEIYSIVSAKGTLSEKAWRLLQKANDNGGKDNISVILANLAESEVTPC